MGSSDCETINIIAFQIRRMEIEILLIGIYESNEFIIIIGNNVVSSVNIVFSCCLFLHAREYRKYANFFGKCSLFRRRELQELRELKDAYIKTFKTFATIR